MTVYPSFASTASLPSALDESANHVDAGEDFEAVSRLVGNRVSRAVTVLANMAEEDLQHSDEQI
jgi:hypothetical protein